ncbi:MAG: LOG family protein [Candidatus Acidiferrales bacterium]
MASSENLIITVFGSSRPAPGSEAYETARRLGAGLARAGFAVATGGYGGTMEAVSRGAREARLPDGQAGGHVIGVTAEAFATSANEWVEEEIRVKTWQERLFKLIELGAGYVALPGGTGTLVELAVVWEWINKGFLAEKPVVILGDFWQPVVAAVPATELRTNPIRRAATVEEAVSSLLHFVGDPRQR